MKNVLISGTSQGIGKATAKEFLNNGYKVTGMDRQKSTIDDVNYTHYQLDILLDDLPILEPFEIVINNAGNQNNNDIDNNLKGTIRFNEKYAIHDGIKSILFIASASAITGAEFYEYAASKGGMVSYMKNVASRVCKYQATCNAISPGGVNTSSNDHIINDEKLYQAVLNETMLHRWTEVEELGKWAYFLTVINKSMTSQNILIDCGEADKSNFIW